MENFSSYLLIVMFTAIAVWLFYGYFKTRGLIYKDKLWTVHRILFLAAGILCLVSVFVFTSVLEWIRLGLMFLCVIGFLLVRDGVGEKGIAVTGRLYPWDTIRAWDYGDYKKDEYRVYFVSGEGDNIVLTMPVAQKDEVIQYIKSKIGKKYTRMKKKG
jgi:hypothetical protein